MTPSEKEQRVVTLTDGSPVVPLAECAILLRPEDDIAVTTRELKAGTRVLTAGGELVLPGDVPRSHKLAVRDLPSGSAVHKYGQSIGLATVDIVAGAHVHTHNLGMDDNDRTYEFSTARTELSAPSAPARTFQGYHRANGRVGTRNYIGVLTSVNCSASSAKMIADQFRGMALDAFPNVDGVVALTHQSGCGLVSGSVGANTLVRTLRGYAQHPNFGGLLVLGLGCEMVPVQSVVEGLDAPTDTIINTLTIQDTGGVRATVRAGVDLIREMLPELNARSRTPAPISELVLGLNCGGSDGYSGITANPALGYASDRLVADGGTSILAETPEVFGAEHLLTRRAVSEDVGRKLLERIDWWKDYARAGGGSLDNNPSPGNKAGGLTTILEKSLGAVAKAGQADLSAVYAVRGAGHRARTGVHGHPWLRPRLRHGDRRRRGHRRLLHDRSGIGPRMPADSVHQTGHEHRDVRAHDRRHGHQLWSDRRRNGPPHGRGGRDLRTDHRCRLGGAHRQRGA